jgi:hypothetical protein
MSASSSASVVDAGSSCPNGLEPDARANTLALRADVDLFDAGSSADQHRCKPRHASYAATGPISASRPRFETRSRDVARPRFI